MYTFDPGELLDRINATINKIEMGINGVPNSKLSLLAEILNVDISYLLFGDNKKESALLTLTSKDGKVRTMQITDDQYEIMQKALDRLHFRSSDLITYYRAISKH